MTGDTDDVWRGAVGDAGEFGLIGAILGRLATGAPEPGPVRIGPGDDAALLSVPGGAALASTDALVEDTHFRRAWGSSEDVGHKAAAQTMADIAAMGGHPTALLVALVVPRDLEAEWVRGLADGLAAECADAGARVIGGDITRGPHIVVAGTALGVLAGDVAPVRRGGARPGNVVAVCGRLGMAAAGLAVLARGFRSPRAAVAAYRRPEVPYAAGPAAAAAGATALIDVSDGLLQDLGHIATASGVAIDVAPDALTVPDVLADVGAAIGVDPLEFLLTGGEDHALAATFSARTDVPAGWTVIGSVHDAADLSDRVTVAGERWPGATGWDHFDAGRAPNG